MVQSLGNPFQTHAHRVFSLLSTAMAILGNWSFRADGFWSVCGFCGLASAFQLLAFSPMCNQFMFDADVGERVKLCNAKLDHENRFQNFYAQSKPKPKRTQTCKSRVSPVSKPSEAVSRQHTHTFRFPVLEPQVSGVNIQSRTIHKQVKRRQNLWFCQVEVNSIPRNVSFK